MKKFLLLFVCCFLLSGCYNNLGLQISELKPVDGLIGGAVSGSIKNVSNSDCVHAQINITFSNGSIREDGYISLYIPKKGEIISFEDETVYGASSINDFTDYDIKIESIECEKTIKDCEEDPNDTWCSDADYEDDEDY